VKLQYGFEVLLETYLSDIQLSNKKLGVQVEVVSGSPQAHALVERCLQMAENEQQLRREKHESNPHLPSSIRSFSSGSSTQNTKTFA
jgi:hypothetical protein